jgi:hypothetical protein
MLSSGVGSVMLGAAALKAGGPPQALAAFTGANTSGVRNRTRCWYAPVGHRTPSPGGDRPGRHGAVIATSGPADKKMSTERTPGAAQPVIRWPSDSPGRTSRSGAGAAAAAQLTGTEQLAAQKSQP